jgi:hypothetical protein
VLSEHEKHQWRIIEDNLAPEFQPTLRNSGKTRALSLMVILGLIGVALLLLGVALNTAFLGVGGFVIMLLGSVAGFASTELPKPVKRFFSEDNV